METASAFAKGFVKEFSPTMIANGEIFKYNWVRFVMQYLQDLGEKGLYEGHMNKCKIRNLQLQDPKIEDESIQMWEENLGRVVTSIANLPKLHLCLIKAINKIWKIYHFWLIKIAMHEGNCPSIERTTTRC